MSDLAELRTNAGHLLARAHGLTVSTREEAGQGADLLASLRSMIRQVEDQRKALTGPLNETIRKINAQSVEMSRPLKDAEASLRARLIAYAVAEKRAAAEAAEEAARAEAEALAAAENAREAGAEDVAEAIIAEVAAQPDPAALAKVAPIRSTWGAVASIRHTWTFEVVEFALVPRQWLTLDEAKVKAAIKAGVREIPGLHIFQAESLQVR